jgi:hypothetical protein
MSGGGQSFGGLPGSPAGTINLPVNAGFVVFEVFETLNTKPTRPAIKDSEMYICDGFMPFGPSNLRTLYGVGDSIYTAPSGMTINAYWFYNLSTGINSSNSSTYAAVLLTNGSLQQVNTQTGSVTQILPAGSITNPNPDQTWTVQWNGSINEYLIITSVQTNGYWLWNGTSVFTAGSISPETSIVNAGLNYSSPPLVNFQSTNGGAIPPTFSAQVTNGFVTALQLTSPGSGFNVDDFVLVSFIGGGSDDPAVILPTIAANSGPVIQIVLLNGGGGYTSTATVVASGGGGSGLSLVTTWADGVITGVSIVSEGSGYTSPPTLSVTNGGGSGSGFQAIAIIGTGSISGTTISDPGSNYTSPPTLTVIGDGQGAVLQAVTNNTGHVVSVSIKSPGYGYTKALIQVSGGNNAAQAAIALMPFGVQGTTCETYENRVWVGDVRKGFFTAPSSASDFTPSDGAGAFESTDSFQRVAYSSYKQTNGFIYLISDSSVNYIGGVQTSSATSSTGVATTQTIFSNLNVDPQIGTPWPSTVQLFSRNIVFANSFGIFVSYGGAVTKISGPLDGIYNSVVTSGSTPSIFPSSAVASIFGIQVYMMLFPIIDQYTGQQVNKLLMWDGKRWFTSSQDLPLTYVASQEINSTLTAWGTNGTELFPLFQNPTTGFQKVVQSKLWAVPTMWITKTAPELSGILNFNNGQVTEVDIIVDNEQGSSEAVTVTASESTQATWVNNSDVVVSWVNNSSQVVEWGTPGIGIIGPQTAGQTGVLMGFTLVTSTEDMTLLTLSLLEQAYQARN